MSRRPATYRWRCFGRSVPETAVRAITDSARRGRNPLQPTVPYVFERSAAANSIGIMMPSSPEPVRYR